MLLRNSCNNRVDWKIKNEGKREKTKNKKRRPKYFSIITKVLALWHGRSLLFGILCGIHCGCEVEMLAENNAFAMETLPCLGKQCDLVCAQ